MTKDRLVSPNEMMQSAKDIMLDGREPKTDNDWAEQSGGPFLCLSLSSLDKSVHGLFSFCSRYPDTF